MRIINKSEIKVHILTRICFVTGPRKVCSELEEFGAKYNTRKVNGVAMSGWILPIDKAPIVCEWYDDLPNEIPVAYFIDKLRLSRPTPKLKKEEVNEEQKKKPQRVYHSGIRTYVGCIFTTKKRPRKGYRAFQVIAKENGEAIIREIVIRDGKPIKDEWKYNDYRISTTNKSVDGSPIKAYEP